MKKNVASSKDNIVFYLRRFLGGRYYPPLVMLLFFLAHTMANEVPFAIILTLFTVLGCLVADDLRFVLPVLLGCVCIISVEHTPYLPTESDYYVSGALPYIIAVGALVLFSSLAVFVIRKRKTAVPLSSLRLRFGFLGFFAAMVLSGLFQENALKNLLYGVGVGASFLAVYLLFGFFHPKTKENATHFMWVLLWVGVLVSAELLVLYLRLMHSLGGFPEKNDIMIGWGTWTHIGAMLAMCLPAPFYLARTASSGYPLYLLLGGGMTVALLASASRAAWLYGGLILLCSLLLLCLGGKWRRTSRIAVAILFFVGVIAVSLLFPKILAFLSQFVQFGVGDNGRFTLWRSAVAAFLAAPIFGRGFFNSDVVLSFPPIMPYLYHNNLLQMLGAAGAVGCILYLFHRAQTVGLLWKKRHSPTALFLLLVPLALLLVSLTDEHFFHIYPAFFYAVALSLAEGHYEDGPVFEK